MQGAINDRPTWMWEVSFMQGAINDRPTWMWEVPFMQGAINGQNIHAHKLFCRESNEFEKIPAYRFIVPD